MGEKEKFERMIEALGISARQFSVALGMERPEAIYKILRGKTTDPGISLYIRIKQAFPQVRYEFLLEGKGPVLADSLQAEEGPSQMVDVSALENEMNLLRARNQELEGEVGLQKKILMKLVGKNDDGALRPKDWISPFTQRGAQRRALRVSGLGLRRSISR